MPRIGKDWTGLQKGKLVVLGKAVGRIGPTYWRVRCECGVEKDISLAHLKGATISCGCHRKSNRPRLTHGFSPKGNKTRIYRIWVNMRTRCNNPNSPNYEKYGGRGIAVCDRWNESFENFLADMEQPPSEKHTLDRIDSEKGYEPGNVVWATYTRQNRRTSRVRLSEAKAKIIRESNLSCSELARILRVNKSTVSAVRMGKTWADWPPPASQ